MEQENASEQAESLQVSAILVAHNQAPALRRAIEALEKSADRERLEILVVDCGSDDESSRLDEDYPGVTILRLPHHFGATKAMNIATRTAKGDYLFLLSPEVEVAPDTVKKLSARLDEDVETAAAIPLLIDDKGSAHPRAWTMPDAESLSAFCRGDEPTPVAIDESAESVAVDYASREALMVRKQFVKGMNYFDGRYGHNWADADLAMQIRRGQKRERVYPAIRATIHPGADPIENTAAFQADRALGAAAFLARYYGFVAGFTFRLGAIFRALFGFRFGEFGALVSGQKVDGN